MNIKTRKHITPGVLATALGVVAALALMAAVVWLPGAAQAQSGPQSPFAPAAPTDVIATEDSATQITVTWTAGTGGETVTGYEVERKVGTGSFTGVTPAHPGTTAEYVDNNVQAGMTYTYRVRANGSGNTNSDWVESNELTVSGSTQANEPPVATGSIDNMSLRINQRGDAIDVSGLFSDPDGDTLTYDADSNNTAVANATIAGSSMLTVVAGNIRGIATITVTADDDNGGMVSITFMVTVAEDYTLTASESGDPMLPAAPTAPGAVDPYAGLRDIPHSAVYLVLEDDDGYPQDYDAHFSLGVAGSADDVTVTITASEILNISIVDSDGLIGAGFVDDEETDLEGSLTVKATDQGSRAFEIEGECESPGGWAHILVEDKDLEEVAEGAIYCKPAEIMVPDDDEFRSDVMTVVSYNDWDHWEMYETVSDGFIVVDDDPANNVEHMVNQDSDNNMMGILVRDEPVVESYQLAISPKETLTLKAGEDPNRLTKAEAEAGQRTIEVMEGAAFVQLTVTSTMEGPAYIRFLDSDMEPFGTDVDEDPMWVGADVVGLDSQGHLALNLMPNLTKAKALAYDQYRVVIPGAADSYAYLDGLDGDYHQGAFRFMNPCPEVGHHFYVEVYESEGKYLKTTEKVMCVSSPRPGPTGLVFEIDSQIAGAGVLSFKEARNAGDHTVLLIDAQNKNIVHQEDEATSPVMFNEDDNVKLNNGWTYHIVVVAEGLDNQYTADAVKDYSVRWLRDADGNPLADVPLSTDAPNIGVGHILCQVEDAAITDLLSNCDTNTAPVAVGAIAAQSMMVGQSVSVHFDQNFSDADMGDTLTYTAMSSNASVATAYAHGDHVDITGVSVGSATVTVTATDMHGASAMQTIAVTVTAAELGAPTNVMATVDDSDPGAPNVTVTWTDGPGADRHVVFLFTADATLVGVNSAQTDGNTTFMNVASGSYVAVVVAVENGPTGNAADIEMTQVMVTVN